MSDERNPESSGRGRDVNTASTREAGEAWSVSTWMTRDVVTVDADAGVGHAARTIASQMISCVVVVDAGLPVGILTERDVAVCAAVQGDQSIDQVPVRDVMSTPLIGVGPQEPLCEALRRVERLHIRHVPVLDAKGDLVGILTQTDLLRAYMERDRLTSSGGGDAE